MRYTLIVLAALACGGSVSAQEPVCQNLPSGQQRFFDDWVCYNGTYKRVRIVNGYVPEVRYSTDRCGNAYEIWDYGNRTRYETVKKLKQPSVAVEESRSSDYDTIRTRRTYDDDDDYYSRRVSSLKRQDDDCKRKLDELRKEIQELRRQLDELDKKSKQPEQPPQKAPSIEGAKKDEKAPKNMKRPSEVEQPDK